VNVWAWFGTGKDLFPRTARPFTPFNSGRGLQSIRLKEVRDAQALDRSHRLVSCPK
jgi:hypothetical protein